MAVISAITSFALVLTIFFLVFLLFGYSKAETYYSIWVIVIFLAIVVFSMVSAYRDRPMWSTQESVLLGQYFQNT